jgi:hypothetical protein
LLLDAFLLGLLIDSEDTNNIFVQNICEHKPELHGVTFQKIVVPFISTTVRNHKFFSLLKCPP